MRNPVNIQIEPGFCVYLALMILLLPINWLFAAFAAATIHEFGHIAAIKMRGVELRKIVLDVGGAKIFTGTMCQTDQVVCAAAGPAAGALSVLMFPVWKEIAVCSALYTAFNLLPIMPFDGARVVRGIASLLFGNQRGVKIYKVISRFTLLLLVYCILRVVRYLPVILPAVLLFAIRHQKNWLTKIYKVIN